MSALSVERRLPADFFDRELRADVRRGLAGPRKQLPPKWFYDDRGSELFTEITRLPEYYPTRAEREILAARADQIAAASQAETLVELGSGSSEKTGVLLAALRRRGGLRAYVPVDVSEGALLAAGERVAAEHPGLSVRAVVADFTHDLGLPAGGGRRMVAFLGGTIGNLVAAERADFLAAIRAGLAEGDSLLLGADLVKNPAVLVPAYDDAAGVTAAFNRNVLAVVNRELDADFDPAAFEHVARWDAEREWIEMALRARTAQTVKIHALGMAVAFDAGEELRTEISAKFRKAGLAAELAAAGLAVREWWTDAAGAFALCLATPV